MYVYINLDVLTDKLLVNLTCSPGAEVAPAKSTVGGMLYYNCDKEPPRPHSNY